MRPCPTCGTATRPLPELYAEEVVKVEADLARLGQLAPPTSRSAVHGFIMAVLLWVSLLVPFFVVNHFWRAAVTTWGVTALWVGLFLRARRQDRELRVRYEARVGCPACGWTD